MRRNKCGFLVLAALLLLVGCKDKSASSRRDLHALVMWDDVTGMEALIARGADVNAKNDRGSTPLHWAADMGHTRAAELLIGKGALIEEQDWHGDTPLHRAIKHGSQLIVQLLLDSDANPNFGGRYSQAPTVLAMERNLEETVRSLIAAGADVTIDVAAYIGDIERTKAFLKEGIDVNVRDRTQWTPLHWAAMSGHKDVAEVLIDSGADLNARETNGGTPLRVATWHRQTAIVELLASAGADVNSQGALGCTILAEVLQYAPDYRPGDESEMNQYRQMVQILVAHGAEVNPEAGGNELLLDFAVRFGLKDLVEKVLAKGNVDVNARAPLLDAIGQGHDDIAELLLAHGADASVGGGRALHLVAAQNDLKLAESLLAHGTDINSQDYDGDTPLHCATRAGRIEMVEFLIAHGAGLNIADSKGNTPLHYAAREHKDVTALLLAKSAPVNTKSNDGDTPLHNAALRGNKEIVELLLARDADTKAKDNDGNTAIDEAARRGHKAIVELLRKQAAKQPAAGVADRGTTTRR